MLQARHLALPSPPVLLITGEKSPTSQSREQEAHSSLRPRNTGAFAVEDITAARQRVGLMLGGVGLMC